MRKVFFDDLPRWESTNCKGKIHWEKSIGLKIRFIYDELSGYLEIIDYNKKNKEIGLKYKTNIEYIFLSCLHRCQISSILGKNSRVVKGENDLWTTHPEIAERLKFKERGFNISQGATVKEWFICENCEFEKEILVSNIRKHGFACPKCSDGISYPEKFMFNLLEQLKIEFEHQKRFEWSDNKIYDFYIPSLNSIIETHGKQHYEEGFHTKKKRNLKSELENDKFKEELAKENHINKYIIVDCYQSDMKYIKNNIISVDFFSLFNLNDIDWLKCHEFACSSRVIEACNLWKEGAQNTLEIGKKLKLTRNTIIKYLKQGAILGWCEYNPEEEMKKRYSKLLNGGKKVVQISLDDKYLKTWCNSFQAGNILGISAGKVLEVCKGNRFSANGFRWMYEDDYKNRFSQIPELEQPVIQLSLDGIFLKEYKNFSIRKDLKLNKSNIRKCCEGKINHAYGFKWMYKEEYDQYIKQAK